MSLYCIESLEPYLVNLRPYIEEMTNKSFEFFERYFRCPYPFTKYDQVFAHEYKWGAMENAGIVTLNDLYLFKDRVSN
jgi:aminopeptidase N